MIKLKWHGDLPEDLEEIENQVRGDLWNIDEDLDGECGTLIFHHVFLTDDHHGPLIFVWGEEGDNEYYHCEYLKDPEWQSLKSFDNDEEKC